MSEETPVEDIVETPVEERAAEPTAEERARAQGWRPPEEYNGAGKPLSAEEYLSKADTELPVMRDRLRKLERETLESKQALKAFQEHHKKALANAKEAALREIEDRKRMAVESGDVQTYENLNRQAQEVSKGFEQPVSIPEAHPEVVEFAERNPWLTTDNAMNLEAQAIHMRLQQESPYMSLAENLAEVERIIKEERYPEKFGKKKASPAMSAAGGGSPRQTVGKRLSLAEVDEQTRADLKKLQRQGLYKGHEGEQKFLKEVLGG